ncbi:hypothetical protein [Veronia pacifica]|uniref:Uncharacterized protein n=1 Tax=Veronia pacifica TaxID=1080227 RepID=A0A1C3EEM4_9GAMM|nr:hypothetical protein [Veronia pacifica]ODA31644.1 hypothetical protein A8L45_16120 [Veronia pacifica]
MFHKISLISIIAASLIGCGGGGGGGSESPETGKTKEPTTQSDKLSWQVDGEFIEANVPYIHSDKNLQWYVDGKIVHLATSTVLFAKKSYEGKTISVCLMDSERKKATQCSDKKVFLGIEGKAPEVSSVEILRNGKAPSEVLPGETLTLSYRYYDRDGDSENKADTKIFWNGLQTNSHTFEVPEKLKGKTISVCLIARAKTGLPKTSKKECSQKVSVKNETRPFGLYNIHTKGYFFDKQTITVDSEIVKPVGSHIVGETYELESIPDARFYNNALNVDRALIAGIYKNWQKEIDPSGPSITVKMRVRIRYKDGSTGDFVGSSQKIYIPHIEAVSGRLDNTSMGTWKEARKLDDINKFFSIYPGLTLKFRHFPGFSRIGVRADGIFSQASTENFDGTGDFEWTFHNIWKSVSGRWNRSYEQSKPVNICIERTQENKITTEDFCTELAIYHGVKGGINLDSPERGVGRLGYWEYAATGWLKTNKKSAKIRIHRPITAEDLAADNDHYDAVEISYADEDTNEYLAKFVKGVMMKPEVAARFCRNNNMRLMTGTDFIGALYGTEESKKYTAYKLLFSAKNFLRETKPNDVLMIREDGENHPHKGDFRVLTNPYSYQRESDGKRKRPSLAVEANKKYRFACAEIKDF